MRKLLGAASSVMVGALLGVVVGFIAARLSHVSTFVFSGSNVSGGTRRAIEFSRSVHSMVTLAVVYGIAAALVVVVVAACFRVRLVRDWSSSHGWMLTALCVMAGVLVGSATVLLAHYGSYTAVIHAGRVGAVRPGWLPTLPIAVGVGAVAGAVSARVLELAGVRLASSKEHRQPAVTRSAT